MKEPMKAPVFPSNRWMLLPVSLLTRSCTPAAGETGAGEESGSTCSAAVTGPNAPPAVIVTEVGTVTGKVRIGKVPAPAPGAIVTAAGTRATAGLLLVRVTVTPLAPAGRVSAAC